jgi:methylase of polypeptide subunit release factors
LQHKTGLFAWFCKTLSCAFSLDLPLKPADALRQLNAPQGMLQWVTEVEDGEFVCKNTINGPVPDLESRKKSKKRSSGQFYTPESFASQIIKEVAPKITGSILDPACGDGSFLIAAADYQSSKSVISSENLLANIYGVDIDSQALLVCLARLISQYPGQGWPELRPADFLTADVGEKFSLIIGNPPYKVNLAPEIKAELKKRYKTAEGEQDLYTFFIERSIDLLAPRGELILLTSHTYLVNHQCRLIRQLVFSRQVRHLFLLPNRFFVKAPGVLPVVINLGAEAAKSNSQVKIHSNYQQQNWQKNVSVSSVSLQDGKGLRRAFLTNELKEKFDAFEKQFNKLGDLCRVGVGIQEAVRRTEKISRFVSDSAENENHKPVLKGRELAPFNINWEGRYIDYGPHLAYAGNEEIMAGAKILYQNIRNEKLKTRLVAAYDQKGFYIKNSISFILPNQKNLVPEYLEAALNSTLLNAWFSGNYHSFHVTVSQVRSIPLAVPDEKLQLNIKKEVQRLKVEIDEESRKQIRRQLDLLICQAYFGKGSHQGFIDDCDIFLEQAARL